MYRVHSFLCLCRYAVVTGANKGIGLEICRQLASEGVFVILTSRDEKRGLEAVDSLRKSGISSDILEFHQLAVTNPTSVASLSDFIKGTFGKLDILVCLCIILFLLLDITFTKPLLVFLVVYLQTSNLLVNI